MSLSLFLLITVLCAASWMDWRSRRIPNLLLLPSFFLALVLNFLTLGVNGITQTLLGLTIGFSLLIIPYLLGGIGAGDVKLLMVIGSFGGHTLVIYSFFLGAIIGGIISLAIYLVNFISAKKISTMPYGIPLALGTLIYILGNGGLSYV